MRPFYENLPFICIFISIVCGVLSAVIRDGRKTYRLALAMSATIAVLSAVLLYCLYTENISFVYSMGRFAAPFGNAIKAGPLQALLVTVFAIVMGLSLLGGGQSLFHDILPEKQGLYFVMTDLLMAGLLVLVYTNDMFTGYVFIEITTIAACAMVMAKDTGPNLIATIRYLFMSLLGSGLFLIGLTLLNSIAGYLLMEPLANAVAILAELGQYHRPLIVSIGLMVVGLGIKGAMFPFHLWLPDAHGGATTSSSAILSGLVLKGYIVLLITLMTRVFGLELMREVGVSNILLTLGLLGMIFGSLAAMREYHVKRMLANSSVAQIGYIFMGLGLGTEAGVVAACFHILVHAACKPLLFCCAGRLSTVSGHHRSLKNLRGSAYRDVAAGVGFTVGALSMIGIPLLGGFVSKLYLSKAALESPFMAVVLLTIAASTVLNALYYVPAILAIWVRPPWEEIQLIMLEVKPEDTRFDRSFFIAAAAFMGLIFLLGIVYHPILNVIEAGVRLM
ncbi:complex I subunit 5 family protein [Oscillibacter ruminantium]|uniref:complex I subunit 5 family protein n=1 Tax=Oscillibacter ruminantium TaxID=1263547 RepID=UPI0025AAEA18|nr:proton-conducting transporter membrane subunit [Oscillibacter ruminantium]MDN0032398.1 proton-conducting transporter membrane subunit [Oscillibacter valericigenes]MEA5040990.1 proton-conducting transporter membrane subunit [Oscillibacter ruminantium]